MQDTRRLTAGVAAMLVVGAFAFVGLYLMIERASTRVRSQEEALPENGSASPGSAGSPAPATVPRGASADSGSDSGSRPEATPSVAGSTAEAGGAAASGGDPEQALDLSLDEPTLQKFLEVRRRMFVVYEPNRFQYTLLQEDMGELRTEGKNAMRRFALLLPLRDARSEGLAATGLPEQEYTRVAKVLYENWWRATASGVDIPQKVSEVRKQLADIEKEMSQPDLQHFQIHRLSAMKGLALEEIGRLEWARSYSARQLLAKIPPTTQRVCEKHAKEIDQYAMKAGELLTF